MQDYNKHNKQIDDNLVWMFARMHVMCADGIVHEMLSHLCYTHLSMEPVIIGFYRQLASSHPVLKLMLPHFR